MAGLVPLSRCGRGALSPKPRRIPSPAPLGEGAERGEAGEGLRRRSGRCDSGLAASALRGRRSRLALDQEPGALDDRHVDHLAVDGDRADPLGERLVVGGDDAAAVIDLLRRSGGIPR